MGTFKNQYDKIVAERTEIIEQIKTLKEDETVKKYLELCGQNELLFQEQCTLYEEIKNEEYSSCNHIWVYSLIDYDSYEGRTYRYCGCIKCGLDQKVLESDSRYLDLLPLEQQIMYNFMRNHSYNNGINTNVLCDMDLAKAIYSKIKNAHPNIDDNTARKYFEIALDNIRKIKVSEARKISRAKRLSLKPKFNKWDGMDVHHY